MNPGNPFVGNPFMDRLEQMNGIERCVQLYSGGLDSRYFLHVAKERGISVVALRVLVGTEDPTEVIAAADAARSAGAEYVEVDATQRFVDDFVSSAVIFNARYGNIYPICSSLSRPLMAMKAVELARQRGIVCIVHNATWIQNSAIRFNQAIRALAPEVKIAVPFAGCKIDRLAKVKALEKAGIPVPESGIHSVDANLWGRVVEAGCLDDPAVPVPEEVFLWTKKSDRTGIAQTRLKVQFERGLPISLDGKAMPLTAIIDKLNRVGGGYGVGRYNGLEDTSPALGAIKNHEVREAPAACALIEAHLHLEQAILSQEELRWKAMVDWDWTRLVVNGGWFSPLKRAFDAFGGEVETLVSGEVELEFTTSRVFVAGIRAGISPCYWNVRDRFEAALTEVDVSALWYLLDIPQSLRKVG